MACPCRARCTRPVQLPRSRVLSIRATMRAMRRGGDPSVAWRERPSRRRNRGLRGGDEPRRGEPPGCRPHLARRDFVKLVRLGLASWRSWAAVRRADPGARGARESRMRDPGGIGHRRDRRGEDHDIPQRCTRSTGRRSRWPCAAPMARDTRSSSDQTWISGNSSRGDQLTLTYRESIAFQVMKRDARSRTRSRCRGLRLRLTRPSRLRDHRGRTRRRARPRDRARGSTARRPARHPGGAARHPHGLGAAATGIVSPAAGDLVGGLGDVAGSLVFAPGLTYRGRSANAPRPGSPTPARASSMCRIRYTPAIRTSRAPALRRARRGRPLRRRSESAPGNIRTAHTVDSASICAVMTRRTIVSG